MEILHKSKFLPGTVEKISSTIRSSGRNRTYACAMLPVRFLPEDLIVDEKKNYPHRVKCHKIIMIYPQPISIYIQNDIILYIITLFCHKTKPLTTDLLQNIGDLEDQ